MPTDPMHCTGFFKRQKTLCDWQSGTAAQKRRDENIGVFNIGLWSHIMSFTNPSVMLRLVCRVFNDLLLTRDPLNARSTCLSDLKTVCWAIENGFDKTIEMAVVAARHGSIDVLALVIEELEIDVYGGACAYAAASKSNLDVLRFLYYKPVVHSRLVKMRNCIISRASDAAAATSNLGLLQELQEEYGPGKCSQNTFTIAAYNGDMEIINWLYENGCPWSVNACKAAASAGNLELLKWLYQRGCPADAGTYTGAAFARRRDIMEWALRHRVDLFTYEYSYSWHAMDAATFSGDIDIVEWLRANRCPWTSFSLFGPAINDDVQMIGHLLKQGCPLNSNAINIAVRKGSLKAAKLLHAASCPLEAKTFYSAAMQPDLTILQWLLKEKCPFDSKVIHNALVRSDSAMLRWLSDRQFPLDETAFKSAIRTGRIASVKWLLQHEWPLGVKVRALKLAMSLSTNKNIKVIKSILMRACFECV